MDQTVPVAAYVVYLFLTVVPIWVLISRTGKSKLWIVLVFVPFGFIVLLWVLAFAPWPAEGPAAGPLQSQADHTSGEASRTEI